MTNVGSTKIVSLMSGKVFFLFILNDGYAHIKVGGSYII